MYFSSLEFSFDFFFIFQYSCRVIQLFLYFLFFLYFLDNINHSWHWVLIWYVLITCGSLFSIFDLDIWVTGSCLLWCIFLMPVKKMVEALDNIIFLQRIFIYVLAERRLMNLTQSGTELNWGCWQFWLYSVKIPTHTSSGHLGLPGF